MAEEDGNQNEKQEKIASLNLLAILLLVQDLLLLDTMLLLEILVLLYKALLDASLIQRLD